MTEPADSKINAALESCASEPIHTPGTVQPFAFLLGVDIETGVIDYASENSHDYLGLPLQTLLGSSIRDILPVMLWHDLQNARSIDEFKKKLTFICKIDLNEKSFDVRAFQSNRYFVIEFEPVGKNDTSFEENFTTLGQLMMRIQACTEDVELFSLVVDLLRHMTQYDRVALHKFDSEDNAEILAEAKRPSLESWIGHRFPAYDIPRQAREIMKSVPLRFIEDVDRTPARILARHPDAAPLDIALAESRGVPEIHLQYMRNMSVRSSLTLSIVIDQKLWGIITFHSQKPRIPGPALRGILSNLMVLLVTKINALDHAKNLKMMEHINTLNDDVLSHLNVITQLDDAMPMISPVVMETMGAIGMAIVGDNKIRTEGIVPDKLILSSLRESFLRSDDKIKAIHNLAEYLPNHAKTLNGCAGVLIASVDNHSSLMVFRCEAKETVTWGGNPEKQIEVHDGNFRLSPRGSFSAYLETVSGRCLPWTRQDKYFAERFLPVISSAERKVIMLNLQRQQAMMIGELNHRVRNILALVRSVSRQASRSFSSLQSYSSAMETRIQALATAHDLTSGSFMRSVSIRSVIGQELDPYLAEDASNVRYDGPDGYLRPEIAPIFALVIHELATNSSKYGSLSSPHGRLDLEFEMSSDCYKMTWSESGGPTVTPPNDRGFGTTLIEQAMAHELNGKSKLEFLSAGVRAELSVPLSRLDTNSSVSQGPDDTEPALRVHLSPFLANGIEGSVMVLEDNYVIAKDTGDLMLELGFADVEIFSNTEDAFDYLSVKTPVFALLDVNLGRSKTSETVAAELQKKGVPFVFATGYGDVTVLSKQFSTVPVVKKPIETGKLEFELHSIFSIAGS